MFYFTSTIKNLSIELQKISFLHLLYEKEYRFYNYYCEEMTLLFIYAQLIPAALQVIKILDMNLSL